MSPRVLIVDDEANLRRMLQALLEEDGHQVRGAATAAEGLAAAAAFAPDVALLDLVIGEGPNGIAVLADLKARWGVSLQALIRRAHTLDIITPSQYRALSAQLSARGWRTQEPIAVPVERPRALRQLAALLYGWPIETQRLANELGLDPAFVRALLEAHAAGT